MKKWKILIFAMMTAVFVGVTAVACRHTPAANGDLAYSNPDLTGMTSAGLEAAAQYTTRYKPEAFGVGDVMPIYHDGVYSFFYLADLAGHPVYRVDTTDLIHFEDKGEALAAGSSVDYDSMIGTGSIVEADGDYYFFYTGFRSEQPEVVLAAKSVGGLDNFVKIPSTEFMLTKPAALGGGNDFRDPEVRYENGKFVMLVSTRRGDEPVICQFTIDKDLTNATYNDVIFADSRFGANVLECPDLFKMGDKWVLTYSIQDVANGGNDGASAAQANLGDNGKMFYAVSDRPDGGFTAFADASLDSHAFYAGKSIDDGENTYLAGWIRKKGSNLGWQYAWGGNLQIHRLTANADGSINVSLPDAVRNYYSTPRALDSALEAYNGYDLIAENKTYYTVSGEYSSYLLNAKLTFDTDVKEVGFALGVSSAVGGIVEATFLPQADKIRFGLAGQQEFASKYVRLVAGQTYDVTLLVEGSAATLYVDNSVAVTARVRNIGNKKLAVFAKDGNASFSDFHLYTPSGYADSLGLGYADLTAKQGETAIKGEMHSVTVSQNAPVTLTYSAAEDYYVRATVAAFTAGKVHMTVNAGGELRSADIENELSQTVDTAKLSKGKTLTVNLTAETETQVYLTVSVETDKRPFASAKATVTNDGTATYTAGKSGVYAFVASMYYGGAFDSQPTFTVGGAQADLSDRARVVTVRGGVRLSGGETLDAGLLYKKFADTIGAHKVSLTVFDGSDEFVAGLGTRVLGKGSPAVLTTDVVPVLRGDFDLQGNAMEIEMNADNFGAQGKNRFVYAYGKAADELYPMTRFEGEGEVWEYKHKAEEANDALEIKYDYIKQGGGYVAALVWVAPLDGFIDVHAEYMKGSGQYAEVQLWHNRTKLWDKFFDGDEKPLDPYVADDQTTVSSVEVKTGDLVIFAVRTAGQAMGTGDGKYKFRIDKGGAYIPFNPSAPLVADYAADFNTARQGDYGWRYLDVGYAWGANEHPTTATDLANGTNMWGDNSKGIVANGTVKGNATVGWKNTTGGDLTVGIGGTVTAVSAPNADIWVRVWILREGGGREKVTDGSFRETFVIPNKGFVLHPNDVYVVMFFDNGGDGCTLDLKIRTENAITIDRTAFDAKLAEAKTIQSDGYTPESFAALQSAISTAENFATTIDASTTYTEMHNAVKALQTAIDGLRLDTSTARTALQAQIERAAAFSGKTLLGGRTTLDTKLAAANTLIADDNATSEAMTTLANELKAILDVAVVQVADFATDFGQGQGDGGWAYYKVSGNFDNYALATIVPMTLNGNAYTADGVKVSVDLWQGGGAAIEYHNYTNAAHTYTLRGQIEYLGSEEACVAFVVKRADGTYVHSDDDNWNPYSGVYTINISKTLNAGESIWIVLRDVAQKTTDSKLTLGIGCNDTLTLDKSRLQALFTATDGKTESDYTSDTWSAFAAARQAAQAIIEKADATVGEVYRATVNLKNAESGLQTKSAVTSTSNVDVMNGSGLWRVVRSAIAWNPARLIVDAMEDYTFSDGTWTNGDGGERVAASDSALQISSNNSGLALVFTVQASGTYQLTYSYTGDNKTNCRIFVGNGNELFEKGFVGVSESGTKDLTLTVGDKIAIHFENFSDSKNLTDALLTFSLTLNS